MSRFNIKSKTIVGIFISSNYFSEINDNVLYLEEVSKSNGLEKELIKFEAAK
jgi:hypothetical protein